MASCSMLPHLSDEDELNALAFELLASTPGLTFPQALMQAEELLTDLLDFADDWDNLYELRRRPQHMPVVVTLLA